MSPENSSKLGPFFDRPTHAEVDLRALTENYTAIRNFVSPSRVMGVIKANGYGHGLVACGEALQSVGADSLGVAYIEEAVELRRAGITIPILVFGGLLKEQLNLYIENGVDVTASSVSKMEQIDATAKSMGRRARVHLKIDTGLERIGVHYYTSETLFDAALRAQHSDVVGVYSHFAAVELSDLALCRLQLERFLTCLSYFESRAKGPFLRHIAASSGLLALRDTHLDMVRPGLCLYGVYPGAGFERVLSLQPTLTLKSQVVYFKVVKKGAGVSYGHRWHAPTDTRIVTIPIGYGDGYSRALSNKAPVIIRGNRHRVVGVVCMDQLMVDIGSGEAFNGDEVVLIGQQGNQRVTVTELAALMETTPHEVLVSLNQRIPRIYESGHS